MSRIVNWLLGYDLERRLGGLALSTYRNEDAAKFHRKLLGRLGSNNSINCSGCANLKQDSGCSFYILSPFSCMGIRVVYKEESTGLIVPHTDCPGYKHKEFEMGKFQEVDNCPCDNKPAKKKA